MHNTRNAFVLYRKTGLVIATTSPVITLAVLGCTYVVALRRNNHHSSNSSGAASFRSAVTTSASASKSTPPTSPPESRDAPPSSDAKSNFAHRSQESLRIEENHAEKQQTDATAEAVLTVIRNRHISVALLMLFVVYATVSHTLFDAFVCDRIDDSAYLRADYSLECEA